MLALSIAYDQSSYDLHRLQWIFALLEQLIKHTRQTSQALFFVIRAPCRVMLEREIVGTYMDGWAQIGMWMGG